MAGPPVSMEEGRGVEVGNRRIVGGDGGEVVEGWFKFGWIGLRVTGEWRKVNIASRGLGYGPGTDTRDISHLSPND